MQHTLLLVDDEPNILSTLTLLLGDAGYRILTATSGKDALERLTHETVHVIISDQRMPYMTGSELLSQVRKLYPGTVRMILSGYADFDAVKDAINEGAIYKFLSKPWDDDALLVNVRDAVAKYESQQKIKQNEATILELMYQDKLTGLCNRLSFSYNLFSVIKKCQQARSKFSLITMDVDRFGTINDTFGFNNGDKVLREIAQRISQLICNKNHVARLGSNQFSIIYENEHEKYDIDTFIDKLSTILKQPFLTADAKLYITVSMGVSYYPEHSEQPDILRRYANLALLHSKKLGGNHVQIYDSSLNIPTERLVLETELHDAIAKKEFVVYYQPLVNIDSGKIVAAEALLRWQHPKHGLIAPDLFLSLCEETGLIVDIGAFVLHTACEQIQSWRTEANIELSVAVNFSQRQFNHPGLIELIKAVLKTTSLPAQYLEIEITESMMMQNSDQNIALLRTLQNLGLRLSLDDFGTGYSSLSYLKQFQFDILKIDKSFINDIAISKDVETIVTAIITMAKSLGLTIIAEGVETQAQLELLKEKKCDIMQGYLFSKPLSAVDFVRLLKDN